MVGVKGRSGNPEAYKYGFGSRPIEVDEEYRSRQKGVPHKRRWTRDKCIEELEDCLILLKKILKDNDKLETDDKKLKNECVRDAVTLMNKILDYMKYLYPPVQQNVNLNLDVTADIIMERLKNWKKKQIVIGEEDAQK